MTYTHLNTDERVMIEAVDYQYTKIAPIASSLKRGRSPIYNMVLLQSFKSTIK